MEKGDLFWWLVDYHSTVNLQESLPKIKNGALDDKGGKYKEGTDKGCPYDGVLIIANGSTLADRLVEDKVIHHKPNEFLGIPSKNNLFDYLNQQSGEDGSYIYDSHRERIANVMEFNNSPPNLSTDFDIYSMIPSDFTSADGSKPLDTIGTKTRLAIKMPQAYQNTEAFQIKRSRYGTLGMGKVTHFSDQGLVEEFLFTYDPSSDGPFVHKKKGIIGLLRTYQRDGNGPLYRASEKVVDTSRLR